MNHDPVCGMKVANDATSNSEKTRVIVIIRCAAQPKYRKRQMPQVIIKVAKIKMYFLPVQCIQKSVKTTLACAPNVAWR